nr:hypothetical protein [Tanacetum cinerariifolium]
MSIKEEIKQEGSVRDYYDAFISHHDAFICSTRKLGINEGYLATIFIYGLQSEIKNKINMFKLEFLLDAYHLACFQEIANELVKGRTKALFTHTSCVKDSWEVMDENGRDLVNGVAGMEVDSGGNGYSNSDVMDVDDVGINLSKEDVNRDFHEEVKNSKECDGSPYLEMITEVVKNKLSVMGLGNDNDKILDGANGCEINESNVRSFTDEHGIRMVEVDKKSGKEDGKDIESNSLKQGVKNDLDVSWKYDVEREGIELRISEIDDKSKYVDAFDDDCKETESR